MICTNCFKKMLTLNHNHCYLSSFLYMLILTPKEDLNYLYGLLTEILILALSIVILGLTFTLILFAFSPKTTKFVAILRKFREQIYVSI